MYGAGIWDWNDEERLDIIKRRYMKWILELDKVTPNYILREETRGGNTNESSEESGQLRRRSKKVRQEISERMHKGDGKAEGEEKTKQVGRKKSRTKGETGNQ